VRISEPIRETRRLLGISQTALAVRAGVSLATLQNIEAGRANPSVSTLERLLAPLGLGLAVEPRQADWDALAAFGLPLTGSGAGGLRVDEESLLGYLHRAALDLSRRPALPDGERKTECLQALLLALRGHFPSHYRRWFRRSPLILDLVADEPSGRVIKLSRLAREALAEIL